MVTMSLSAGIVELHRSPLADANDVAAVGAGWRRRLLVAQGGLARAVR